ncbi:DNA-directed DNA polymerase II small subunit [Candidatus Woesearchaeota archaeon]|nr:DNA-directed DNA polymerase II small subunit [Candidatus Woesearchaeota archaeon]
MLTIEDKKEIIRYCLEKNILAGPELFATEAGKGEILSALLEKHQPAATKPPLTITCQTPFKEEPGKKEVQDFVDYFVVRYRSMEKILRNRTELQHLTSIARAVSKKDRETTSLIGMVSSIQQTKNKNIYLSLEDPTGKISVLVNKDKKELFEIAKDTMVDEIIGVVGTASNGVLFASEILLPEVPLHKELKKYPTESYIAFLSDLHVGSLYFLEKPFLRFIKWINGDLGTEEQQIIAKKIGCIFIIGDLVDGVGVYPEQDNELSIKDITAQYERCAELLSQIPKHIPLIICPGNHDAVRIAEPQPPLYKDIAKSLWDLPNAKLVPNPAHITVYADETFPGFDILMYHGYSFDYYVANNDSIRNGGGYDRADLIMKFLLRRRHLAPTYTSTQYMPYTTHDPLVIDKIPDFLVTGHIHKTSVSQYRNVTLICGSCWQSTTKFQERVGHKPEPCRVPVVNLQTRKIKVLNF